MRGQELAQNKVFYFLISLQVLICVFAIRLWPATDYPMFSLPRQEFHEVLRLELRTVFADGEIKPWGRESYGSFGVNDHRLQNYVKDLDNPRLNEMVREKIIYQKLSQVPEARRVQIVLKTLALKSDPDLKENEIEISDRVIREIPIH